MPSPSATHGVEAGGGQLRRRDDRFGGAYGGPGGYRYGY